MRTGKWLLCLLLPLCLMGCWNRKEADQIDYVLAVGIDRVEGGQVALTIQTPVLEALKPKQGGGGDKFKTLSVKGKTVFEAIRNYINITGMKLFWGHTQMYLIGEEAAKEGVDAYLDFFSADPELRGTSQIAVVKGKAKDVMEAKPDLTPIPSYYMSNMVKNAALNGKAPTVSFADFNRMQAEPVGGQPYLPLMELMDQQQYDRRMAGLRTKSSAGPEQSVLIYTGGTALFQGTRMIGTLNERESRGMVWTKGFLKTTIVTVNYGEGTASLELVGGVKSKKSVRMEGEQAYLKVKVEANLNVGDRTGFLDVSNEGVIQTLEKGFAEVVRDEVHAAFNKATRELHCDVLAFGNALSDYKPKIWAKLKDDWEKDILPRAKLEVEVTGRIRRTSRTLYSPWVPSQKP